MNGLGNDLVIGLGSGVVNDLGSFREWLGVSSLNSFTNVMKNGL